MSIAREHFSTWIRGIFNDGRSLQSDVEASRPINTSGWPAATVPKIPSTRNSNETGITYVRFTEFSRLELTYL